MNTEWTYAFSKVAACMSVRRQAEGTDELLTPVGMMQVVFRAGPAYGKRCFSNLHRVCKSSCRVAKDKFYYYYADVQTYVERTCSIYVRTPLSMRYLMPFPCRAVIGLSSLQVLDG